MSLQAADRPDFLDVPPLGGGILLFNGNVNIGSGVTTVFGPYYVGNAASLGVQSNFLQTQPCTFDLFWYNIYPGGAVFQVPGDEWFTNNAHDRIQAVGLKAPYVALQVHNTGAGAIVGGILRIWATPPGVAPVSYPQVPSLMKVNNAAVGANANIFEAPAFQKPGPAKLWFVFTQIMRFSLQEWNGASYDIIYQNQPTAANVQTNDTIILPQNDWQVEILNQAAAAGNAFIGIVAQ